MTLSPETKISIKTAFGVVVTVASGVSIIIGWQGKRLDAQTRVMQKIQADVNATKRSVERVWTLDHQQVWTDIWREKNQAGYVPTPNEVLVRLRGQSANIP